MLVTKENKELFRRQGAVLLRGTFRDWVKPLEYGVERLMHRLRTGTTPKPAGHGYGIALDYQEPFAGGAMVVNASPFEPAFTEWQERSDAAELFADLLDSSYARAWVDAIFTKEPAPGAPSDPGLLTGAPPDPDLSTWDSDPGITPWHSDVCNWPFWGEKMAIVWVALTDIGPGDAPLVTIDGSHAGSVRYHSRFETQSVVLPQYRPWSQLLAKVSSPESRRTVWYMRAGDCVVMHCATLHASLPQARGARLRMSYSCRWLGDDVIYQPNALTRTLDPATRGVIPMRPGQPPPDRYFPRTWLRGSPRSCPADAAGPRIPGETGT